MRACAQARVDAQLKPLQLALDDVVARLAKGGQLPSFGSLAEWAQVRRKRFLAPAPCPCVVVLTILV